MQDKEVNTINMENEKGKIVNGNNKEKKNTNAGFFKAIWNLGCFAVGIVFLLFAWVAFEESIVSGSLLIVAAILCLPFVRRLIRKKFKIKGYVFLLVVIMLVFASLLTSETDESQEVSNDKAGNMYGEYVADGNTEIQPTSGVDVSQGTGETSELNDTNSNVEKGDNSEPTTIPETVQNEEWKEKYNIGETLSFKAYWQGKESLIESVDYELTFMDEIVEYYDVMGFEKKEIYIPFSIANNSKQELAFDLRSIYVDIDGYEYHDRFFRVYDPINESYYPVDFGDIMPSTALIPAGGEYLFFLQLSAALDDALMSTEPHKVQIGFTYDICSLVYDGKFEIPSTSFWTVYEDYFQVLHPRYKEVYVTTEKEVDNLFCGTWYADGMGDYPVLTVNKNGDCYDIYIIDYIDNDYHVWAMTGKYDYEKHCMVYDDLTRTRYSLYNYEYQAYEIAPGYTSGSLYYDLNQIRHHWSQYGDSISFYRSDEEYKSLEGKLKEIGIIKEPVTGENVPSYELGNIFELGSSPVAIAEACEKIGVPIITYNRGVRYYSYDEGLNISREENEIYVTLYGCNTANYSLWGYYVGMDVETLYAYIEYDELEIIDEVEILCSVILIIIIICHF